MSCLAFTFLFLSALAADFTIVNEYPREPHYIEGLFYLGNDRLLESNGMWGDSSLRKTDLITGATLQQASPIPPSIFAEGTTRHKGLFFQLTYQSHLIYMYTPWLALVGTLAAPHFNEGWGLTSNGDFLIASDGTERLYFLSSDAVVREITNNNAPVRDQPGDKANFLVPNICSNSSSPSPSSPPSSPSPKKAPPKKAPTKQPTKKKAPTKASASTFTTSVCVLDLHHTVTVKQGNTLQTGVNELEYFRGYIYANIYPTPRLIVIDAQTGEIVGALSLATLRSQQLWLHSTNGFQGPEPEVVNGVASYVNGSFLVTGKYWTKIYQVFFNFNL